MFDELRRMALFGSGIAELTRYRAEQMVKDLVRAGDLRREQAQGAVKEMLEMARSNRKELLGLVRAEIKDQVAGLGFASARDAERLERRVARLEDDVRKLRSEARDRERDIESLKTVATKSTSAGKKSSSGKKTTVKKKKTRSKAKTSASSKKTPAGRSPEASKPADTGAGE